ncbi:polysaccharide biosynthesis tyrosine autokinase [Mycolicibacterium monacense]|uniref:polysaccharide biosynthesis tyrosine autokinase n=1 Tax=Mycolicibacterium monacense TaxID=85693 RepID=UPI0009F471A3|nr:polysaccharide biosynthesis tyrosine autokinase [Mycolicibacterium monacense]QHP89159.1 polysaccharide biosynthesis tyrosine autokinase [Mycolicibacterium monacense DSM 44395]
MNFQDFVKSLRARWIVVSVATVIGVLAAVAVTMLTTPLYQASTRLFVSTTAGTSATEIYQGNRFSQERVVSYAELLNGETVLQRTIDKLGLQVDPESLQKRVKATAVPDTVLISVTVLDESPVRARDIANTLSDEFVSMVRSLETPEGRSQPDARVVVEQKASIPEEPVVPRKLRNIVGGLALGLLLGIGIAIVLDVMDNTIKSRETLEELSGTGIVGTVPLDKQRRRQPAIDFEKDNSGIAESFRKLRTNLQFLAVDNPPRVIVVTSSVPHEGKSTTAINLALVLAEAQHKVLLVDADMRRPMLHKYLGLVGSVGFSTVLAGSASLDEALQDSSTPGLSILASGPVPPNPSELLGSKAAKKLIGDLRARFDYVIVDSTPLLAVTDAAIVAAEADGALVIAKYGQTKRDQLRHAVQSLRNVGAPILGAVFTMMPVRGSSAYSYQYGYYGEGTEKQDSSRKL